MDGGGVICARITRKRFDRGFEEKEGMYSWLCRKEGNDMRSQSLNATSSQETAERHRALVADVEEIRTARRLREVGD